MLCSIDIFQRYDVGFVWLADILWTQETKSRNWRLTKLVIDSAILQGEDIIDSTQRTPNS